MRFYCGRTWAQRAVARERAKRERLTRYHLWFAWRPLRIGNRQCVWLETVWRVAHYHAAYYGSDFYTFDYRLREDRDE